MVNVQASKGMYDKVFTDVSLADGAKVDIIIKPVQGVYLKKLLIITSTLSELKTEKNPETNGESTDIIGFIEILSKGDTLLDCIDIVTDSISRAYPSWDKDTIDEFVNVNVFILLPLVSQASIRNRN